MNYSDSITGGEQEEKERRAEAHMKEHSLGNNGSTRSLKNRLRTYFVALEHSKPRHPVFRLRAFVATLWFLMLYYVIIPSKQWAKFVRYFCSIMCFCKNYVKIFSVAQVLCIYVTMLRILMWFLFLLDSNLHSYGTRERAHCTPPPSLLSLPPS